MKYLCKHQHINQILDIWSKKYILPTQTPYICFSFFFFSFFFLVFILSLLTELLLIVSQTTNSIRTLFRITYSITFIERQNFSVSGSEFNFSCIRSFAIWLLLSTSLESSSLWESVCWNNSVALIFSSGSFLV